jgi:hypothetical protein
VGDGLMWGWVWVLVLSQVRGHWSWLGMICLCVGCSVLRVELGVMGCNPAGGSRGDVVSICSHNPRPVRLVQVPTRVVCLLVLPAFSPMHVCLCVLRVMCR